MVGFVTVTWLLDPVTEPVPVDSTGGSVVTLPVPDDPVPVPVPDPVRDAETVRTGTPVKATEPDRTFVVDVDTWRSTTACVHTACALEIEHWASIRRELPAVSRMAPSEMCVESWTRVTLGV